MQYYVIIKVAQEGAGNSNEFDKNSRKLRKEREQSMMRKSITRTMATSIISGYITKIVDGKPIVEALQPIKVAGKLDNKEGLKALKEIHGKDANVLVSSIEVKEDTYEISVEDFMKYSTKVESK